jgi:hypothetical protein
MELWAWPWLRTTCPSSRELSRSSRRCKRCRRSVARWTQDTARERNAGPCRLRRTRVWRWSRSSGLCATLPNIVGVPNVQRASGPQRAVVACLPVTHPSVCRPRARMFAPAEHSLWVAGTFPSLLHLAKHYTRKANQRGREEQTSSFSWPTHASPRYERHERPASSLFRPTHQHHGIVTPCRVPDPTRRSSSRADERCKASYRIQPFLRPACLRRVTTGPIHLPIARRVTSCTSSALLCRVLRCC